MSRQATWRFKVSPAPPFYFLIVQSLTGRRLNIVFLLYVDHTLYTTAILRMKPSE